MRSVRTRRGILEREYAYRSWAQTYLWDVPVLDGVKVCSLESEKLQ